MNDEERAMFIAAIDALEDAGHWWQYATHNYDGISDDDLGVYDAWDEAVELANKAKSFRESSDDKATD